MSSRLTNATEEENTRYAPTIPPLPFVPFGDTVPACGITVVCLGTAERDGVVILCGYAMTGRAAVLDWGSVKDKVAQLGSRFYPS